MLTRLRVKGFKNLLDSEVRFGPFTCIAGPNGAGKSNLFDAILFLSDLTNCPIVEAAARVRSRNDKDNGSLSALFTQTGRADWRNIELEADFLIPRTVKDDFGREAVPSSTYLTYSVELRYIAPVRAGSERIELVKEELTYVLKSEAKKRLGFQTSPSFLDSVLAGTKRSDYISTEQRDGITVIQLRQDRVQGPPSRVPASSSPRTVLSTVNTDDRPTALAARREMQSWAQLQLEPSKLRKSDDFSSMDHLSSDGEHLPSTILRLGEFDAVANLLSKLLPDVESIRVDIDEARRSRTLFLRQRDKTEHPARSLSDGTLRFLALAVLACDPSASGVICMEEPENGIHPARVPAIVELLKGMAVDTTVPIGDGNPLRQVLVNTHSPIVIRNLSIDDLVVAMPVRYGRATITTFGAIKDTWRSDIESAGVRPPPVTKGTLVDYLQDKDHESLKVTTGISGLPSVGDWAQQELVF
jgi:predicted ATPase